MERNSTDKRLDDLNSKVDQGFERVDSGIRGLRAESRPEFAAVRAEVKSESAALRAEMKAGFDAMNGRLDSRFDALNARFDALNVRFDATHRLIIQVGGGMLGALVVAVIGLIAT